MSQNPSKYAKFGGQFLSPLMGTKGDKSGKNQLGSRFPGQVFREGRPSARIDRARVEAVRAPGKTTPDATRLRTALQSPNREGTRTQSAERGKGCFERFNPRRLHGPGDGRTGGALVRGEDLKPGALR